MLNFKKISSLVLSGIVISSMGCMASFDPSKEELSTAEKVGRETARVQAQVEVAAEDLKKGYKDNKNKFKQQYRKGKK